MMRRKSYSIASALFMFLMVLVAISAVVTVSSEVPPSNGPTSQYPTVQVTPDGVAGVSVGETFNVTVAVSGLGGKNLYGFDINFTWDTSVLQCVSHEVGIPVETHSGGVLHQPVVEIMNQLNPSTGTYWLAYASVQPAEPFNGDGVFFTITFVLLQASSSRPYALEHVILADSSGNTIPLSSLQSPETLASSLSDGGMTPSQILRNKEWLDWWITVTTGCPRGSVPGTPWSHNSN
jgi:hypothetical protein